MSWGASFESYPGPGEQGAVTNFSLREIKAIVKDYLGKQHIFDEGASPECSHNSGMGTVINIKSTPTALNVIGALAYDPTLSILYRDRGSGLGFEVISGLDHGSLLNLTDDDCHPQYVLKGSGIMSSVTIALGYKVTGLNVTEIGYTDTDVMPYSLHIGEDVSGGAKHSNNIITTLPTEVRLSCYDKIKASIVDSGAVTVSGGGTFTWLIGRMAFTPVAAVGMNAFYVQPLFNATPPDDWVAGFTFDNLSSSQAVFHATAGVIDA